MAQSTGKKDTKAFSVRDLPRDLVNQADRHMKALEIKEWHKKFAAGILQMIRHGALPPDFLRLVCAEGTVAKEGGTMYPNRGRLVDAVRESMSDLVQNGQLVDAEADVPEAV